MDEEKNDILKQLNTIFADKNMSENLKNIINNFSSSDKSQTEDGESNNASTENFDFDTFLKMKKIMDSLNSNNTDKRANLLNSLKPYLSENKKNKIDMYIKFLKFATVFENINPLGGDLFKNE